MKKHITLLATVAVILSAIAISVSSNAQSPTGGYLLSLSDVDMVGTAYIGVHTLNIIQ